VLQPRRVAARMVATQLSFNINEKVGNTIGYIIKNENIQNKNTKVLVVTEAILTRMIQDDQELSNISMIIFDEFHERSIHSDLALALSLEVQELLREDLKIILMSATLNTNDALELLGADTSIITSNGRLYEVQNIYLDKKILLNKNNIYDITYDTILNSLKNDDGDILVFVSSLKHINKLSEKLNKKLNKDEVIILPLYSSLNKKEQDIAIRKNSKRKIILSTNIAQTSLTIDGVKVVIDTGYENQSNYNFNTAMNSLNEQFISLDSAIQRAGRAGRTDHGKCYKIWHQGKILEQSDKAEILRSDLSSLILDLALWGDTDFNSYKFIDIPKDDFISSNKELLEFLNMIDSSSNITEFGQIAIKLGLHPRFAFMILSANELGFAKEACILASIFSSNINYKEDFKIVFFNILANNIKSYIHKDILKTSNSYYKKLQNLKLLKKSKNFKDNMLGVLTLFAYPDRLAKQRKLNSEFYKLSNGKGAILKKDDILFNTQYLVVPNILHQKTNSIISSAIKIEFDFIKTYFKNIIHTRQDINYDKNTNTINIQEVAYILKLDLYSKKLSLDDIPNKKELIKNIILDDMYSLLDFNSKVQEFRHRINFVNYHKPNTFIPMNDEYLQKNILNILEPYMNNIDSIKDIKKLDIYNIFYALYSFEDTKLLEDLAPPFIKVPSNRDIKIDYSDVNNAILSVKLQELFGLFETPKILNNTISLQIHLLSPALRQIAITNDIKSFWDNAYNDVVKDMKNKYKRHYWPENPYEAIATTKIKRLM
jgi:ATP-dependent helicase HrpB